MIPLRRPVGVDRWEAQELEKGACESMEEVRVWCGTYNVNGKRERALVLSHWLKMGWETSTRMPDLFVIALQEMIDLSATNVVKEAVTDSLSRAACEEWVQEIRRAFEYVGVSVGGKLIPTLVSREHMCGIAILVFAVTDKGRDVREVASARIPTGAGGRLGNKGACVARCRMASSTACFVGAHLSAHRADVEARNADYQAVVDRKCFKRDRFGGVSASEEMVEPFLDEFGVLEHDVVVFFGDLNYRILKATPDKEVHYLLKSDLSKLLALDQLNVERAAGRVFSRGFVEPPVTFAPTYKYAAGTVLYDHEATPEGERNASGKKVRCPAWCDRVLYRVQPRGPRARNSAERVACVVYDRADDRLRVSDHRPVFALLDISVGRRDSSKKIDACRRVGATRPKSPGDLFFGSGAAAFDYSPLAKQAGEAFATRASPAKPPVSCRLDPPHFWLRAGVQTRVALAISHASDRPVPFAFSGIPEWLRVDPEVGTSTGEAPLAITVKSHLQQNDLVRLAANAGILGATLVLRCGTSAFLVPACITSSPDWITDVVKLPLRAHNTPSPQDHLSATTPKKVVLCGGGGGGVPPPLPPHPPRLAADYYN
ncbi:hypothetical protein CTAYLR_000342 [Chrysophaeum taylorii]|uniref:Inositol polyphosphate-related phosphatase domain-containing protein n=1 Tax=Chrysophaeum taylorii TaxID=2483200 RepID=A0AAD7UHP8_9STRA|nr:hypothetical protein CTAYLR_000342 [Chrysophaeum taylorii]